VLGCHPPCLAHLVAALGCEGQQANLGWQLRLEDDWQGVVLSTERQDKRQASSDNISKSVKRWSGLHVKGRSTMPLACFA
jgi:hypothetical protein